MLPSISLTQGTNDYIYPPTIYIITSEGPQHIIDVNAALKAETTSSSFPWSHIFEVKRVASKESIPRIPVGL